jgi:sugar lactone lactonase YvrE
VRSVYERGSIYNAPAGVLLVAGNVYWADGSSGGIWEGFLDGRPARLIAQTANVVLSLAVAGGRLYWSDPSGATIQTMPLAGGDVLSVPVGSYPTNAPNAVAVDDRYVYWNDVYEQTVKRMPLAGGEITVLASGQGYLGGLATDGQNVYWANTVTTPAGKVGAITKVSRDGGAPVVLTTQPVETIAVTVAGGFVYWTADALKYATTGTGSLSRIRADGSEPATVLVDQLTYPYGIVVDSQQVYWVEGSVDGPAGVGTGRVMKLRI